MCKLELAILRWSAVIPNAIFGNPSAVFNIVVVGWIGVLKLSSMSWYVEYLMSDIAAPESIMALQHFPAWTMIVGQSIMRVTVTGSCLVSPPCSWESLLGEASFSLNDLSPLLSHWNGHQNCNSPCVDPLFSLWCSSYDVVCFVICWSARVTYVSLIMRLCKMDVSMIDFDLWSGTMRNLCVLMICSGVDVVCWNRIDGYNPCMWNLCVVSYFWGGGNYPHVMTWNSLYMSHDNLSCSVCKMWLWFFCPCLRGDVWSLTWCGNFCVVWIGCALLGFLKEVVLCGQSITMWPYSSHSKHLMLWQFLSICPCSWQWKQWSSSFDIMLTIDGGVIVVVSYCTVLSFSILDIVSLSICSPFSYMWVARTMGILQIFNEYPDGGCIIHKIAYLSFCLESVDICCEGLLFLLLDLHKAWSVSVDISIAKLEL